jgi:small subunit ribosomal protein S4
METACKKCRREGVKLILKGERCLSNKCAIVKRPYAPGSSGQGFKGKMSEYGKQLREKQKAKRIYNINETQFKNYVTKANNMIGNKTENLMQLLETRVDNVILRAGFAPSHSKARQCISHGLFTLNGHPIYTPSIQVQIGDIIAPKKKEAYAEISLNTALSWLDADTKKMTATIRHLPAREEIDTPINESLIIEYYSR